MEKKIINSLYSGGDATFLRCISSETLDYFDLPVAHGDYLSVYEGICELAHRLNPEHGIVSGGFVTYDLWYRFHVLDGEFSVWGSGDKEGLVAGNVVGSEYKGFWINPDTFEIHSLCDILYNQNRFMHGSDVELEIEELPNEKEVKEFIEKFNNKIREARK